MTTNGTKYTFVCDPDNCDTLIEVTCASGFDYPNGVVELTCPCGRKMSYISATILPTTTKEEKMETVNKEDLVAMWKQELELTYGNEITELKNKLATHQNCDYWKAENGRVQSQIIDLIRAGYAEELDSSELLITMAEIIDFHPTKEIQFTATMTFSGRIDVPMADLDDFDLTGLLEDAYVDINNGDVVIDNYELYDAEEC